MDAIKFKSVDHIAETKKKERLLEEGGIYYEKITDPDTGEEKTFINILGVTLETSASKEDIESIKEEIILSNLDQTLLRKTAECYSLKQALLFEGDPGAGKTFLYEKFIEMIYGKGCPIDTLVGSPRTSELDILGHWAPRGDKGIDNEKYNKELAKYQESENFKSISSEFNEKLSDLNEKLKTQEIDEESFGKEFSNISTDFTEKQRNSVIDHFSKTSLGISGSDWEFKQGALLRAYSGRDGKGYPLIVDEFNIIPSNYQQIFLQIGGQSGGLSDQVSFWGNGGKTAYKRGNETAIFFASNFPEKTEGRSEVVAPMSDRLVWTILSDKEYQEKKRAIVQTAGGRLKNRKSEIFKVDKERVSVPVENAIEWDKVLNEKLGEQIADIVDVLSVQFEKNYVDLGDKITIGNESRKRTQKLEISGRNAMRLFSYLDKFQVRNEDTGLVDFTETLRKGFEMYYVGRLADKGTQDKAWKLFDELLTGDTGKLEFERNMSLKDKIKMVDDGKKVTNIITRKEILDYLTESCDRIIESSESKGNEIIMKLKENGFMEKLYVDYKNGAFSKETHIPLKEKIYKNIVDAFSVNKDMIISDDIEQLKKLWANGVTQDETRYANLLPYVGQEKVTDLKPVLTEKELKDLIGLYIDSHFDSPESKTDFEWNVDKIIGFDTSNFNTSPSQDPEIILQKFLASENGFESKVKEDKRKFPVRYYGEPGNYTTKMTDLLNSQEIQEKFAGQKAVIFPTEQEDGWKGGLRISLIYDPEPYDKILKLLKSGFKGPVVLTGAMTPSGIISASEEGSKTFNELGNFQDIALKNHDIIKERWEDLFRYKNVSFLQEPITKETLLNALGDNHAMEYRDLLRKEDFTALKEYIENTNTEAVFNPSDVNYVYKKIVDQSSSIFGGTLSKFQKIREITHIDPSPSIVKAGFNKLLDGFGLFKIDEFAKIIGQEPSLTVEQKLEYIKKSLDDNAENHYKEAINRFLDNLGEQGLEEFFSYLGSRLEKVYQKREIGHYSKEIPRIHEIYERTKKQFSFDSKLVTSIYLDLLEKDPGNSPKLLPLLTEATGVSYPVWDETKIKEAYQKIIDLRYDDPSEKISALEEITGISSNNK